MCATILDDMREQFRGRSREAFLSGRSRFLGGQSQRPDFFQGCDRGVGGAGASLDALDRRSDRFVGLVRRVVGRQGLLERPLRVGFRRKKVTCWN